MTALQLEAPGSPFLFMLLDTLFAKWNGPHLACLLLLLSVQKGKALYLQCAI